MPMQSLTEVLGTLAANKRTELLTACANGADDDLPEEERPSRALVAPLCRLKHGDDVAVADYTARVICPGRGLGWFYAFYFDESANLMLGQFEAQYVTDRLPADSGETPLPIFEEP